MGDASRPSKLLDAGEKVVDELHDSFAQHIVDEAVPAAADKVARPAEQSKDVHATEHSGTLGAKLARKVSHLAADLTRHSPKDCSPPSPSHDTAYGSPSNSAAGENPSRAAADGGDDEAGSSASAAGNACTPHETSPTEDVTTTPARDASEAAAVAEPMASWSRVSERISAIRMSRASAILRDDWTAAETAAANMAQADIDAVAKKLAAEHEQVVEKLASYEATKAELQRLVEATSSTYRRREMEEAVAVERQKKKPNVEAALQSLAEVQKGRMEQLEKLQVDEASARASAERAQEKEAEIRKEHVAAVAQKKAVEKAVRDRGATKRAAAVAAAQEAAQRAAEERDALELAVAEAEAEAVAAAEREAMERFAEQDVAARKALEELREAEAASKAAGEAAEAAHSLAEEMAAAERAAAAAFEAERAAAERASSADSAARHAAVVDEAARALTLAEAEAAAAAAEAEEAEAKVAELEAEEASAAEGADDYGKSLEQLEAELNRLRRDAEDARKALVARKQQESSLGGRTVVLKRIDGKFGLEVNLENQVVRVRDGSAAQVAGLSEGEFITHLDRKSLGGKPLSHVLLGGTVGETMSLTVLTAEEVAEQGARAAKEAKKAKEEEYHLAAASESRKTSATGSEEGKAGSGEDYDTLGSPLFDEWLALSGAEHPGALKGGPIGSHDALVIVDMQADLVPWSDDDNPHGGRFGVEEGERIAPLISMLIEAFVVERATVVATRSYHPRDHVAFLSQGGPFPVHCVQGSRGSHFLPAIATKLEWALREAGTENTLVAFKSLHEDVDSPSALPYFSGSGGRVSLGDRATSIRMGAMCGCTSSPWTGALLLKCSNLSDGEGNVDINAPPDVLAVLDDGVKRQRATLHEALKGKHRIFICGLALDVGVIDTCQSAIEMGAKNVILVLDATRPVHIAGVGGHGSGFVSDPAQVIAKAQRAEVQFASASSMLPPEKLASISADPPTSSFPDAMQPMGLSFANVEVTLVHNGDRYTVSPHEDHIAKSAHALLRQIGMCSPRVRIPSWWPLYPPDAVEMCWAYPLMGIESLDETSQLSFTSISISPEHYFYAHGGFLFISDSGQVVGVQAVSAGDDVHFLPPIPWRDGFTQQLEAQDRIQMVTYPPLLRAGASSFCWIAPEEQLRDGDETWAPSATGGFVYYRYEEPAIFFPCDKSKGAHRSVSSYTLGAFSYAQKEMYSMFSSLFGGGSKASTNATTAPQIAHHG